MFGYLVKPFRETDLLPAIATARARHDELAALREEAESLAEALAARKAIERAKGLLMEKEGLTEQDAFARLRKASQISGRPLKVIADAVVATLEARRMSHPSAERARRGFEAFRAGDLGALLDLFAPDASWHVPGANAMTGSYRGGRDRRVPPPHRRADGRHLSRRAALGGRRRRAPRCRLPGPGRAGGTRLDIEQALLVTLAAGLWAEIRAQPLDQAAFDAFWA